MFRYSRRLHRPGDLAVFIDEQHPGDGAVGLVDARPSFDLLLEGAVALGALRADENAARLAVEPVSERHELPGTRVS